MHWRVFDFCQKAAPDVEAIRCTGEFDDDVRKAAPNAEAIGCTGEFFFLLATKLRAANC